MTSGPGDFLPDPELEQLVSRFLDHTITAEETAVLEQRLRDQPDARDYCARALRFDATLQEALLPQPLQWEETRRVVFDPKRKDGGPAWSIQRQQTVRYGNPGNSLSGSPEGPLGLPGPPVRRRWLWPAILVVSLAAACAGSFFYYRSLENVYALRNGDFEAMDLSRSISGIGHSILYWQDNFSTSGCELCEIGRVSGGKIFAPSGRNIVRLQDRAFLNQLILNKRGTPLKALPGLRVILTGQAYSQGDVPHSLRGGLRFVASGYPDMIQYEAATDSATIPSGGWHPLRMEFQVPADLLRPPSDLSSKNIAAPSIDLSGKELTLSLDCRSPGDSICLDDLKIEVLPPGK
ncbi:MAG: hypothetical protein JWO82_1931 [Akkermansiaceae bacterium]|nr:hypothetical protein [Akkermansiaceae bacterium]